MTDQLDLPLTELHVPEGRRPSDRAEAFAQFHAINPRVYERLVVLARRVRNKGRARCSIRMLWEFLRHELILNTTDPNSDFKLNDHYTPFYARMLMGREADLAGLFETRGDSRDDD